MSPAVNVEQLKAAKAAVQEVVKTNNCHPIMVRLAWHDSGSYCGQPGWPCAGGATGSIRFAPEINHGANAGLSAAVALLQPVHDKFPEVSWADLIQMASAVAIELAGGPAIPLNYGRADASTSADCAKEGFLPAAAAPFPDGTDCAASHLRKVFHRMGFSDQEIVALSGAHTIGRARPDRSGMGCPFSKYTKEGPGKPGGQSWTSDWLTFNNSYFTAIKAKADSELLVLPTDAALFEDAAFKPHAEKYAADQEAFFADYMAAHMKLADLGVKWVEGAPVKI